MIRIKRITINRSTKIILSVFYILIIYSLFNLKYSSLNGYESSIYTCHKLVWFLLLLILSFCIFILSYTATIENKLDSPTLYATFFLLLLSYTIIITMPLFIGYAFYGRGDEPTHLGNVIDLMKNGYVRKTIYPITHIFIAILSYVSNLNIRTFFPYIGPIYSLISLFYIFVLAKYISHDVKKSMFIVSISILAFFCLETNPNRLTEFTIPIFLYVYIRSKFESKLQYSFLLVLFAILFPFFHPLSSLIVIISIFISDLLMNLFDFSPTNSFKQNYLRMSNISLISVIILLHWFWFNSWYWNYHIGNVIRWLVDETQKSTSTTEEVFNLFSEYNINFIEVLLKFYGSRIVYLCIAFFIICLLFYKMISNRHMINAYSNKIKIYNTIAVWTIIPILFSLLLVFAPSLAGPQRSIRYAALFSPFFVYIFMSRIRHNIFQYIAIIFVIILTLNSALSIHSSPYIHVPTNQISQMEINGMSWFFDNRIQDYQIKTIFQKNHRFGHLILGVTATEQQNLYYSDPLPDHFGYDKYLEIGDYLNCSSYLLLGKYDQATHLNMYESSNKFNMNDFNRVYYRDYTVQRIYTNGEFFVLMYSVK